MSIAHPSGNDLESMSEFYNNLFLRAVTLIFLIATISVLFCFIWLGKFSVIKPVCPSICRSRPPSQGLVCPELVVVLPAERCVAVAAGLDLADALAE